MCTEAAVEVTSRSMEHSGKQQIIATVLCMEAQAIVAAIQQQHHSNSAMEAQASDSYPAAADHSNSAMEAQASDSYPAAADHIATVLWKCRLVAAIQQLYKLLYKSCIEAKQNNGQV